MCLFLCFLKNNTFWLSSINLNCSNPSTKVFLKKYEHENVDDIKSLKAISIVYSPTKFYLLFFIELKNHHKVVSYFNLTFKIRTDKKIDNFNDIDILMWQTHHYFKENRWFERYRNTNSKCSACFCCECMFIFFV